MLGRRGRSHRLQLERREAIGVVQLFETGVQLVPTGVSTDGEIALMTFLEKFGCIFGVSSEDRPMGSEPTVVCRWVKSIRG